MTKADLWQTIHAERRSLASDLSSLTPEQWNAQSLCSNWSVVQTLGHMTATARMTPGKFFPKLVASGFSFEAVQAKGVAAETSGSASQTLNRFAGLVDATSKPPGPVQTVLGETIVHSADIRLPLGIDHGYPTGALKQVADFYRSSNLVLGGKKRVAGLRLVATDADWSAGSGPEVSGPLLQVVLAITGRKSALGSLSGPGVATLASRMI